MARIRVGDHHWYGLGVPLDYTNAADHYRLASHNTDAKAAAQVSFRSFEKYHHLRHYLTWAICIISGLACPKIIICRSDSTMLPPRNQLKVSFQVS